MALTKNIEIDRIEVVENNTVQIRTSTVIEEDGVFISRTFHRSVIVPGDDYSDQESKVKAICDAVHTTETIKKYKDTIKDNIRR
jgi:hypothetical protein